MRTFKQHRVIVEGAMNQAHAANKAQAIIDTTNVCLGTLVGMFPVGVLCRKLTMAPGEYLPDNFAGINAVWSAGGDRVWERGQGAAAADEEISRYYTEMVHGAAGTDALPFKDVGSITAGEATLTCANLDALSVTENIVGLTIRIVNETYGEYFYKIVSANGDDTITLDKTHPYTEEAVEVTVGREDAMVLRVVDDGEEQVTSGDYDVYYWIYPNPLTKDTDTIPLQYPDALEVMTIRRIPETKNRRPVSKKEIDEAIKTAKKKEPNQSMPSRPINTQGTVFKMANAGTAAYTARG